MNIEDHPAFARCRGYETPIAVVDGHLVAEDHAQPGIWWIYTSYGSNAGGVISGVRLSSLFQQHVDGGFISETGLQTILALYRLHH